jgi:hypothetical protein
MAAFTEAEGAGLPGFGRGLLRFSHNFSSKSTTSLGPFINRFNKSRSCRVVVAFKEIY